MRRLVTAIVVATVATTGLFAAAGAEPGDLDGAFGVCGGRQINETARVGALGNRIVVVRIAETSAISSRLVVTGLTQDGVLDRSFGQRGHTTFALYGEVTTVGDLLTDAQGHLLVGITSIINGSDPLAYVVRLRADGTTDPSFGGGIVPLGNVGITAMTVGATDDVFVLVTPNPEFPAGLPVTIDLAGGVHQHTFAPPIGSALPEARTTGPIAIQGNGYVALDTSVPTWRLVRWNADGTRDATFTPIAAPPTSADYEVLPRSLAVTADDRLVVLWSTVWDDTVHHESLVVRYAAGGGIDPSFGDGGLATIPVTLYRAPDPALRVDPSGSIQVITDATLDGYYPIVAQLTSTGQLDASFGTGGVSGLYGFGRRGVGWTEATAFVQTFVTLPDRSQVSMLSSMSRRPLSSGAGLMLQWNGDAWPTRFGSDPGPECPYNTPHWPEDDVARGITTVNGKGGYVVDAFGGIHRFSFGLQHRRPAKAVGGAYWPGWDITRGIASKPDGTGGYVLDAYGGVHTFRTGANPSPAPIVNGPYWPGWNITRGIALLPDGNRGYILDAFGGIHPFTTPGHAMPPALNHTPYWPGWDIARGIGVLPDGTGGYVVDAYGGAHPFGIGTHAPPPAPGPNAPYAAGEDWVRGYTFIAPKAASSGVSATARAPRAGAATGVPHSEPVSRVRTLRGAPSK